jgi:hypothetical protein
MTDLHTFCCIQWENELFNKRPKVILNIFKAATSETTVHRYNIGPYIVANILPDIVPDLTQVVATVPERCPAFLTGHLNLILDFCTLKTI